MFKTTTYISIITLALCLSLVGCGNEGNSKDSTPQPDPAPTTPADDYSNESTPRDTEQHSTTMTFAGVTLNVTVLGSIAPNAVLDVTIVQTAGALPTAIRVYVGDASGVGSVKTKVHSHGASSHAHVRVPATLPANCSLWIEVQNADGTFGSGSFHVN